MIVKKEELGYALNYLSQQPKLAVDTETTGLRFKDRLFSVQFASQDKAFHFDKRVLGDSFKRVGEVFENPREWYLQNAKFDLRMLSHDGLSARGNITDLEVLVRLARNDVLSTKLADTARKEGMEKLDIVDKYIDEHNLITKVQSQHWDKVYEMKHFDRVPLEIIGEYGLHDPRITYDLCEIYKDRIDPRSQAVLRNEQELTRVCLEAEMNGCLIDREHTKKLLDYEVGLIHEAKHQFLLSTGQVYDGSKAQLLEVFTKAGETIPKTAKGNPSLNADALEEFTTPVAQIVQRIRHYEKRCSTYYSSFLDLCDDEGRLHADMRQAGTTTGRFSYRDPNLQNVPKEDEEEDFKRPNLVRSCFIPEKDHVLVQMDYSQQEYRLMLAYADQWDLIERVMSGVDVHQATADMVGITRKHAKTLNFAILYGSGPDKIAWMLGITPYEAAALRDKYLRRLPMVNHFINKVRSTAKSRGYVYNWLGRKLHLPAGRRDLAYQVPNHLIQGGGADICKRAMVEMPGEMRKAGARLHSQIHDALIFNWPKENLDMIPSVKKVMEEVWPETNKMRMAVDVKWSDKSLAERDMVKYEARV